ncbi:MAG: ABC transporter ATP-binding protein [Candidatus Undinarchaeales archaeon]|jgi:iron(III) transport system ATP-binding protein|nr:ABC transporter ATP-binding protein [Candidatus Undinarchaeales archaeon]MDP7491897.1 ABC transporter ATP-binding protein [Candidatus Undinarchaeales archaeon]
MTRIELRNVAKSYDDVKAIDDMSFTVEKGEIFAFLGPSGCGKTTALRLIAGVETPDSGEILIDGEPVAGGGVFIPPNRRNVGMVFQGYALFPHLRVKDNIAYGLTGFDREKSEKIVDNMLEFVGLEGLGDRYPHQLSGGQQQRVALARALAPCPVVILLDEPLSNLDADMRAQMRDEVLNILKKAHSTAILVTHDQAEAFSMADCVAVLNAGRTEQVGTPEEIYHFPSTRFVADFVGQADFIDGLVEKEGIETELGVFPNKAGLAEGSDVQLMIRPDDITFTVDDQGGAVVEGQEFRGSENIYTLSLASGKLVHSSRPSTLLVERGTRVSVTAAPAHIVAFSGDRVARPP